MSADKGGALVRSPPGLVPGVDAYNPHIGPPTWDPQTPPGFDHHEIRKATVTKISAQERASVTSKSSKKNKSKKQNHGKTEDDSESQCGCDGWARARQLEHDMDQLRRIHDSVLHGLHQQMEEMKQKNRDMTFQLLMGPYASTVTVSTPLSPESEATSPKENKKIVEKTEATTPNTGTKNDIYENEPVKRRNRKGRTGDPRQVKSLNLEILEEEAEELKRQLEEERTKNEYLVNVAEELKRQVRETQTQKLSLQTPLKQAVLPSVRSDNLGQSTEYSIPIGGNSSIRLPQILKQELHQSPSVEEPRPMVKKDLPDQESNQPNISKSQRSHHQKSKKKHEKNTLLPSLNSTSDNTNLSKGPINLDEEETIVHGLGSKDEQVVHRGKHKGRGKHRNGTKNGVQQSFQAQGEQVPLNPRTVIGAESKVAQTAPAPKSSTNTQHKKPIFNYDQQSYLESLNEKRGKPLSQEQVSDKDRRQPSPRTRGSGSLTRARGHSRGRISNSSRDSSRSGRTTDFSPPSISRIRSAQHGSGSAKSTKNQQLGHSRSDDKENRPKSSSSQGNETVTSHSAPLATYGSSTSSAASQAPSSAGKPKHKSRTHRRSKNKNKKESSEAKVESNDQ